MKKTLRISLVAVAAVAVVSAVTISTSVLRASEEPDAQYDAVVETNESGAAEEVEYIEVAPAPVVEEEPAAEAETEETAAEAETEKTTAEAETEESAAEAETEESAAEAEAEEPAGETQEASGEPAEEEEPAYSVSIVCNVSADAELNEGDLITLSAVLSGFEGKTVAYQWAVWNETTETWDDIPDAEGADYTFAATEESIACTYNVFVSIVE